MTDLQGVGRDGGCEGDGLRRAGPADVAALEALQQAAYAPMAEIAGGTPLPLLADYGDIVDRMEVWVAGPPAGPFDAALILDHDGETTLVWSVAVATAAQSKGFGRRLLAFAETRAHAAGATRMRLYTHRLFTRNREIYRRFGYRDVGEETIGRRDPPWVIVHMEKNL